VKHSSNRLISALQQPDTDIPACSDLGSWIVISNIPPALSLKESAFDFVQMDEIPYTARYIHHHAA
jgi:hypothetical protein